MSSWQVDLDQTNSILADVNDELQDMLSMFFNAETNEISTRLGDDIVGDLVAASGYDGVVAGALIELLGEQLDGRVSRGLTRYQTMVQSVVDAKDAFQLGDENQRNEFLLRLQSVGF